MTNPVSPGIKIAATLVAVPVYFWLVMTAFVHFQANPEAISELAKLGDLLFNDTNLSEPKGLACASCHIPALKHQGNNGSPIEAVAAGSRPSSFGTRNVPSIMYAYAAPSFSFVEKKTGDGKIRHEPVGGFFWDGRADTLADQITGPLLSSIEMNNASVELVVEKVKNAPYAQLAIKIFGKDLFDDPQIAIRKLGNAISAYERTEEFSPFSSKFDNYLRGTATLSSVESKGFELFKDPEKGNCLSCHAGNEGSRRPEDWLFTNFSFEVSGLPRNPKIPVNANPSYYDLGLCARPGIAKRAPSGFDIVGLCGSFKIPTLRNVALTAPYFHNGSINNLRRAVEFYATRDTREEQWYGKTPAGAVLKFDDLPEQFRKNVNMDDAPYTRAKNGKPRLDDGEIDAIVAFLGTLTDAPVVE